MKRRGKILIIAISALAATFSVSTSFAYWSNSFENDEGHTVRDTYVVSFEDNSSNILKTLTGLEFNSSFELIDLPSNADGSVVSWKIKGTESTYSMNNRKVKVGTLITAAGSSAGAVTSAISNDNRVTTYTLHLVPVYGILDTHIKINMDVGTVYNASGTEITGSNKPTGSWAQLIERASVFEVFNLMPSLTNYYLLGFTSDSSLTFKDRTGTSKTSTSIDLNDVFDLTLSSGTFSSNSEVTLHANFKAKS